MLDSMIRDPRPTVLKPVMLLTPFLTVPLMLSGETLPAVTLKEAICIMARIAERTEVAIHLAQTSSIQHIKCLDKNLKG